MSKEITFSFVIPVYKKPPDIFKKCLESLFDMSFKNIEVICVFDGPDKELEEIAGLFPKAIKKVIDHGGACKARNVGSAMAKGRYIACWDADCYAKPEMAKRWLEEFEAEKDADFVYSGYEVSGERGSFESEPFNAYSLQSGNYIASMFPIKREKAPKWDESLSAAQDWDFWLTAVENGCKGSFIPGSGFVTDELSIGISSKYWRPENREETMRIVRQKHGIPDREMGIFSLKYYDRSVKLAKALNADVIKQTGRDPRNYKMVFNLGYNFMSRFEGVPSSTVKVQYWPPLEVEALGEAKYSVVKETIRVSKEVKNLCGTMYEKNKLMDYGVEADVLTLPIMEEDLSQAQTTLPEEFSVLVLTDESFGKLHKELEQDLPHIKFGRDFGVARDYSCIVSFYQFATLDEAILSALVNGRTVISNVQSPFCGYVDPSQPWDKFKADVYEAIRIAKTKSFNQEARDYYANLASVDKFKSAITDFLSPKLEVVA